MARDIKKEIDNSSDPFDILCSSKDLAPAMKTKLMRRSRAEQVFYPKTKNQVRKILINHNCVIRGGATSHYGQIIPEDDETIIDMAKFDDIKITGESATIGAATPFIKLIRQASYLSLQPKVFPLSYVLVVCSF